MYLIKTSFFSIVYIRFFFYRCRIALRHGNQKNAKSEMNLFLFFFIDKTGSTCTTLTSIYLRICNMVLLASIATSRYILLACSFAIIYFHESVSVIIILQLLRIDCIWSWSNEIERKNRWTELRIKVDL